jgi:hypothetical protein
MVTTQVSDLRHAHLKALERSGEVDLANRLLLRLGEGEVAHEDGSVECQCVHVFRASGVDLSIP